jgi:hypothetical protein
MNGLCEDCSESVDPLKLIREGTDQAQRTAGAPNAALVPVDERRPEHAMVFAAAYASYLEYVDAEGNADGDWHDFFASDLSAQLAVAAIEDVAIYRSAVKALLRELEDPKLPASPTAMIDGLSAVFDCVATLAIRLDGLKEGLPADHALRATLGNLIGSQLSPALQRLIGYYVAGKSLAVINIAAPPPPDLLILGGALESFETIVTGSGLSGEWPAGVGAPDWAAYVALDPADYTGAYGPAATPVDQVNHLATHNLFTAACEGFLGVYARVVEDARAALEASFTWDGHEPHYALFLAFLRLLEYARAEANTLPHKHLEFYYRDVLRLKERPAQPGRAHILVELAKHVDAHLLAAGTLMKAGKDDQGADAHFATDRDLVANKAAVAELKSVYRHPSTDALPLEHGRIFASPVTNVGESWHPFAEKVYRDGALTAIAMPPAQVGFAIASHYLWMAEGKRSINLHMHSGIHSRISSRRGKRFRLPRKGKTVAQDVPADLLCRLTTEKGWLDKTIESVRLGGDGLEFTVELDGNDAPVTPYDPTIHGYGFATTLPVMLVQLTHSADVPWDYATFADINVDSITLRISVDGVKSLTLSNDHGPLDASKPFLPYGSGPVAGSALLIGSKEVFQKEPDEVTVHVANMVTPAASALPTVSADYLFEGGWLPEGLAGAGVDASQYVLHDVPQPPTAAPDLTPDAPYTTASRAGFIRLKLSGGFGTATYPLALAKYISGLETTEPTAPVLPMFGSLTLDYEAEQEIDLTSPSEANGRFFHITPFGHAQQVLAAGANSVPLLPQFLAGSQPAEGELYVGVAGLMPPQNLALLFQVVEGTANPLLVKPDDHIQWTYLRGNEWVPFAEEAVADGTEGLLASGIATLAVPADASSEHTLLPAGMHWVRLAVASDSDAVCRLVSVAAQALSATYVMLGNGATSHTAELPPGTITKLDPPDAAVKGIQQPFPTFGGRPTETPIAFATRVSERLRHKDRAIALWDYERLILQAFPAVYQARCLNHTRYEPSTNGSGIYRELAAGHVTVVTIPDLTVPDQRDPLRPYTSLRVLGEIERFLTDRMSCFARLHVRNPQFEEVRVDLRVRFREGVDETFHVNRLKHEMTEFLSPWAFRNDARPSFNGKVHKSVIVNFVEERSYVDYVSDVRLFRRLPGVTADGPDLEEVVGSRAVSILVSVPADQHGVHPIPPGETSVPADCGCATAVA